MGNISSITDTKTLFESFKQYGNIEGVEMFNSKGFDFVKLCHITEAALA